MPRINPICNTFYTRNRRERELSRTKLTAFQAEITRRGGISILYIPLLLRVYVDNCFIGIIGFETFYENFDVTTLLQSIDVCVHISAIETPKNDHIILCVRVKQQILKSVCGSSEGTEKT